MGTYAARRSSTGGASSGGTPTLTQMLAALGHSPESFTQPEPEPDQGFFGSIKGFVGNAARDLASIPVALTNLGAGAIGDLYKGVADIGEAIIPGGEDTDHDYFTDDFFKSLVVDPGIVADKGLLAGISPGMQSYLKESYGLDPLGTQGESGLPDFFPEKGLSALAERPFSTLLDVYGAGKLGAGIPARAAARRIPSEMFERGGARGGLLASDVAKLPESVRQHRLLPGLRETPTVEGLLYPGGVRRRVTGQGQSYRLREEELPLNPVMRARKLLQARTQTIPLSKLSEQARRIADQLPENPVDAAERFRGTALAPEVLDEAMLIKFADQHGLQRVEKATVRARSTRGEGLRFISNMRNAYYRFRNMDLDKIHRAFSESRIGKTGLAKHFHKVAEGILLKRSSAGMLRQLGVTSLTNKGRWLEGIDSWLDTQAKGLPPELLTEAKARVTHLRERRDQMWNALPDEQQAMLDLETQVRQFQEAGGAAPREMTAELDAARRRIEWMWNEGEAVEEYGRQLMEHVGSVILGEAADPYAETIGRLLWERDDLVRGSIRVAEAGGEGLTGGYQQVMETAFGPLLIERKALRLASGKKRTEYGPEEGGFPDEYNTEFDLAQDIDALFDANGTGFWKELRDDLLQNGYVAPMYFPEFDPRRMQDAFVFRTKGAFGKNPGAGSFKHRSYWNYLEGTYLADDPVEAYARRAAGMRRNIATHDFTKAVAMHFGRKLRFHDDFNRGSEVLFNPHGHQLFWRTKTKMDELIAQGRQRGLDQETAASQAILTLDETVTVEHLIDALDQGKDIYAIPKVVGDQLQSFMKYEFGSGARLVWDEATSAWRTSVLGLSPRWVANNTFGNTGFAVMQGTSLVDVARSMREEIGGWMKANQDVLAAGGTPSKLYDRTKWMSFLFGPEKARRLSERMDDLPIEQQAAIDSGIVSSVQQFAPSPGKYGDSRILDVFERLGGSRLGRVLGGASRRVQAFNSFVERHYRRAGYMTATVKQAERLGATQKTGKRFFGVMDRFENIARRGLDEADVAKNIDEMNFFYNDYQALNAFEQKIVRRFIAPFYSFYRHVAMLTLKYPIEHPGRAVVIKNLGELAEEIHRDTQEEMGLLPHYLETGVPIGEGAAEGALRFLNTRAANPLGMAAEVLRHPENITGSMHPLITSGYEWATGRDVVTGREFTSPDVQGGFGGPQFGVIRDAAGNIVGVSDQPTKVRPSLGELAFQSVPFAETIRDLLAHAPLEDIPLIGPAIGEPGRRYATGETMMTPEGEPEFPQAGMQQLGQWLGLSTTDFNQQGYEDFIARQRAQALIEAYRLQGLLPPAEDRV